MSAPGKIAALGEHNGELCVSVDGEDRLMSAYSWGAMTILPMLDLMAAWNIGVLHVHRSALPLLGLPDELDVPRPGERRAPHPFVEAVRWDGKLVGSRCLAPSITAGNMEVLIGAYQDGAGDPFEDAADAQELLAAHLLLAEALQGWQWRNSAAVTGWKMMHAPWMHGPRAARLAAVPDWPEKALPDLGENVRQVEVPYGSWAAPDTPRDSALDRLPYVSAWDVNGQRLAACARLSLGIGGLEHRTGTFDKALPGYHRITHVERPFETIPAVMEPGWHTTPRVAMAAYLGIDFMIAESWVWTKHVPYLNPWYERLRDARADLAEHVGQQPVIDLAGDALKQCYLQPLGRLRSRKARERGDLYYRPDWYDAIIGQELAREYLRLHQLASGPHRCRVLAVYFDTIILETDLPGAEPPELPVSGQLGKYKLLGAIPTDDARAILYDGERANVAALVKALKAAAGEPGGEYPLVDPPGSTSVGGSPRAASYRPAHGGFCHV